MTQPAKNTRIMNMRNKILGTLLMAAVVACGGEDAFGPPPGGGPGDPGTPPPVEAAAIMLSTDTPSLPSAGTATATITAYVTDASNNLMADVPVQFSASSGSIITTQPVTAANGAATAVLSTLNDPSNRDITVTARVGAVERTLTVPVSGTSLTIQGPDALVSGVQGNYTVILNNSAGAAVPGAAVTLTAPSATLSSANLITDSNGRATFNMSQTAGGTVALQASGAGAVASRSVTVSADNFTFITPEVDAQVPIGTPIDFTVNWQVGGAPQADGTLVNFAPTRGTPSAFSASTTGGNATITLTSTSSGEAVVTASNTAGTVSTTRRVYFVATTANAVSLQASPGTVGINQTSTLTATVRDPTNNLVAGKTVRFEIVNDPTQGSLTVGTAVTDLQGRASTVYNATSVPSALNGVTISATVVNPAASDPQPPTLPTAQVNLTVAGAPSSIVFGTGNTIEQSEDDTLYIQHYTALVKDITGAGVSNVPVTITVEPVEYRKGFRFWTGNVWAVSMSTPAACLNEDLDFNGILDPSVDNDENGNGTLQPGGVVTVVQDSVQTASDGGVRFRIVFPQDHADWVRVRLRARTTVQGTEFSTTTQPFWLPGAASDFRSENISPPGPESPFGSAIACSDPN